MLDTLLESKAKKERSQAGVALSVAAHTALIGAALYATAQARVEAPNAPETVRPVYFPPAIHLTRSQTRAPNPGLSPVPRFHFVPPKLDIRLPTVDIATTASRATDFSFGAISGATVDHGGPGKLGGSGDAPFLPEQVEKQVSLAPGNVPPRYPETLRAAGIEGQVVASFIVGDDGRVEEASIRILRSDNRLYEDVVRTALGRMRFAPAESHGRKVRQLVQMPFVFTLSR